jgi:SAM-dependent methyltransferase
LSTSQAGDVVASRALPAFLSLVCSWPVAEMLDLGPAIGPNIAFLGQRIGCKIHVKDLYGDLERHGTVEVGADFAELLQARFGEYDGDSIDAVLCWDVFDYLVPAAADALAATLDRVLRPGGALLAFFGAAATADRTYTRYVIEDESHLRYRVAPAPCGRQRTLQNREILALFPGLTLSESVLLKSGLREVLFRKPD